MSIFFSWFLLPGRLQTGNIVFLKLLWPITLTPLTPDCHNYLLQSVALLFNFQGAGTQVQPYRTIVVLDKNVLEFESSQSSSKNEYMALLLRKEQKITVPERERSNVQGQAHRTHNCQWMKDKYQVKNSLEYWKAYSAVQKQSRVDGLSNLPPYYYHISHIL